MPRSPKPVPESHPSRATPPLPLGEFVALMALLVSLAAFAIDAMLPALPAIARDLGAEPRAAQQVITSIFAGFALGQALFGPLSDDVGRKRAIYGGVAVFIVGCLVCMTAQAFAVMLVGRVLQGVGASALRVVSMAVVRDQHSGAPMARIMALVMAVFILVPVFAPAVGQLLLARFNWRAIFVVLLAQAVTAVLWLGLRQPETLLASRRRPLGLVPLWIGAREVIRHPVAMGYTLVSGLLFGGMIGYLATSQPLFQDLYGVGEDFPLYFGGLALSIGLASVVNSRLVERLGMRRVSTVALWMFTLAAFFFVGMALWTGGKPPLWAVVAFLFVAFAGLGLTFGNLNALAMEPLGHLAGIGAALVGSISTVVSLLVGGLIGESYDGSVWPLALGFALVGPLSILVMTITERARATEPLAA